MWQPKRPSASRSLVFRGKKNTHPQGLQENVGSNGNDIEIAHLSSSTFLVNYSAPYLGLQMGWISSTLSETITRPGLLWPA